MPPMNDATDPGRNPPGSTVEAENLLVQGDVSRRSFLTLLGASVALAGLEGCSRQPLEEIVPYVHAPEEVVPGIPLRFASAMPLGGYGIGVLVESHMGRPTKVDGNPLHPAALGGSNAFMQASVLTLYDPARSNAVLDRRSISTFDAFLADILPGLERLAATGGEGLRLLTGTVTSPTLVAQMQALQQRFPQARWYRYSPINRETQFAGARLAFGDPLEALFAFEQAAVVLSLDDDFLSPVTPGHLRYARDFMAARRVRAQTAAMNRLYVVEGSPSLAGAMADHRIVVTPSGIEAVARGIAAGLGLTVPRPEKYAQPGLETWIDVVVQDLREHAGRALVLAGHRQPEVVHLLAHGMNAALGNIGQTVSFIPPVEEAPETQTASLRTLVQEMEAGRVEMLFLLNANPLYTAPADIGFERAMTRVPTTVHLGLFVDETAAQSRWHIPATHYLEDWGDCRAFDGTVTIQQPLIAPLYQGRSVHEIVDHISGLGGRSAYEIVRSYWATQFPADQFEQRWVRSLHDGLVEDTAFSPVPVRFIGTIPPLVDREAAPEQDPGLQILFAPDPSVWDGEFSHNAWLQELPRPFTKLTWNNAAHLSATTARRFRLTSGEVVELEYQGRSVRGPVWVMPGHPDDAVTVHFGYGRSMLETADAGTGFNAYILRTSTAPWFGNGLKLRPTGETSRLANAQEYFRLEGRELIRRGTFRQFLQDPDFAAEGSPPRPLPSLYPEYTWGPYEWGMVIDLTTCIGCAACVVACQAENNIPAVGKRQVELHREMHWLRVDRYYQGGLEAPDVFFQPVPCMHCENAPCEVVCPVEATLHDSQGLNEMIYNRCVGTRYCSNNCPYKVRRFNFLDYIEPEPAFALRRNPEVSVRSRGVMEKCTYCIQRISRARIDAGREGRMVRDGEVTTACQDACPTSAIIFGNLSDPDAQVTGLKREPHNYAMLAELNTRPRTTYLARITNPNPLLMRG